jgi:hypothetical protein
VQDNFSARLVGNELADTIAVDQKTVPGLFGDHTGGKRQARCVPRWFRRARDSGDRGARSDFSDAVVP